MLLLIVGSLLILNPYYLWPHHGTDAREISAVRDPSANGDATPVSELPPETAAFTERLIERTEQGRRGIVVPERESAPTDRLVETNRRPEVSYNGTSYWIDYEGVDRSPPVLPEDWRLRVALGFLGSLAIALAVNAAARRKTRLSSRTAWGVPGVWTVVLLATIAYDDGGHGVGIETTVPAWLGESTFVGASLVGIVVLALPAVGVVVGVAVREKRWRADDADFRTLALVTVFVAVTWLASLPGVLVGWLVGDPADGREPPVPNRR